MVFMGYPVPAGEIERWQGERRDDHDDAQMKHRAKIEAKKTFAGLTRGGGRYQKKICAVPAPPWTGSCPLLQCRLMAANLPIRSAARSRRLSRRS
jgi:hypothetical protein